MRSVKIRQATDFRKGSLCGEQQQARAFQRERALSPAAVRSWPLAVILLTIVAGVWANSLSAVFVFDDTHDILGDSGIQRLWPIADLIGHSNRPLIRVTFAINYALGGLVPWGYHLVNLLIHLAAALTLFSLLARTFESYRLRERFGARSAWLAFIVSLLWALHPLNTSAVTYAVHRYESGMGLFVLLTFYLTVRGASIDADGKMNRRRAIVWYSFAAMSLLLAICSKEVAVVIPPLLLLYDRIFLATRWRQVLRLRWALHAAIGLAAVGAAVIVMTHNHIDSAGFDVPELTPRQYAMTESGVIPYYLRLVVWPHPLVVDYYDWPIAETISAIPPTALITVLLAGSTLWALFRKPAVGFAGAWLLLILAPTSSILPLAFEAVAERRMYLPLTALIATIVLTADWFLRNRKGLLSALAFSVAVLLGSTTFLRNRDYRDFDHFYQHEFYARPHNLRTHLNYACALDAADRGTEAMEQFDIALKIDPDVPCGQYLVGDAFFFRHDFKRALEHLTLANQMNYDQPAMYRELGVAQAQFNQLPAAILNLRKAVKKEPKLGGNHYYLASVLYQAGALPEAESEFIVASQLAPEQSTIWSGLGQTLEVEGKKTRSAEMYRRALAVDPANTDAAEGLTRLRQPK